MSLRINTNMASISALKNFSKPNSMLKKAMQQLSSGKRIANASYDAAGLAIANRMEGQSRGYSQAIRNASDGISMARTAEGAQHQVSENLIRIRELSIQAANGTLNSSDREAIQSEINGLTEEIDRVSQSTEFNGQKLLDGSLDAPIQAGDQVSDQIDIQVDEVSSSSMSVDSIDVTTPEGAMAAIASVDAAIDQVSSSRANLGATENRLASAISNLQATHENTAAAQSRIMDVDIAKATADLAKGQILSQSSISMILKTSEIPQQALGLLG